MGERKKPALVVMAAGMGSRYGGLKQIDPVDEYGNIIMDFSIFDAKEAGFEKVVFIIKKAIEKEFKENVGKRMERRVQVEYVYQELDKVPEGFEVPEERVKPWGTGHAILCCKDVVNEPFAVINADDYYGADSFRILGDFLRSVKDRKNSYCMIGFNIENTLSENGGVSRGLCEVDSDGFLSGVKECHGIERKEGRLIQVEEGENVPFPENASVSMNMWGFTPDYFDYSEKAFVEFLKEHGNDLKTEFYIPSVVNDLINNGTVTLKVEQTPNRWFGVTYAADREATVAQFKKLVEEGLYPTPLF